MITQADLTRLGLFHQDESKYLKIEDVSAENLTEHFWQSRYKEALNVIDNQLKHIEFLEKELSK